MGTPPSLKFPALGVSHRNRLGCLDEAVPDFFEEPQPIGNAQRLDLLADGAHGRILRFSFCDGKPQLSTHNAPDQARPKAVACIRKLDASQSSGHRSSVGRCRIGGVAILDAVIHSDPNILGGTPVFRGTRVPLKNLVDYLAAGDSVDEFLDHFPSVKREQAMAILELAAKELLPACARPSR